MGFEDGGNWAWWLLQVDGGFGKASLSPGNSAGSVILKFLFCEGKEGLFAKRGLTAL